MVHDELHIERLVLRGAYPHGRLFAHDAFRLNCLLDGIRAYLGQPFRLRRRLYVGMGSNYGDCLSFYEIAARKQLGNAVVFHAIVIRNGRLRKRGTNEMAKTAVSIARNANRALHFIRPSLLLEHTTKTSFTP